LVFVMSNGVAVIDTPGYCGPWSGFTGSCHRRETSAACTFF
jgi:hypothetical protein